jgi:hypothetical protein
MQSDTQPKNGRVRLFVMREIVSDSGRAVIPSSTTCATLYPLAMGPTFETTMRSLMRTMVLSLLNARLSSRAGLRARFGSHRDVIRRFLAPFSGCRRCEGVSLPKPVRRGRRALLRIFLCQSASSRPDAAHLHHKQSVKDASFAPKSDSSRLPVNGR